MIHVPGPVLVRPVVPLASSTTADDKVLSPVFVPWSVSVRLPPLVPIAPVLAKTE